MVIHAILLYKKVDDELQVSDFIKGSYKYISFKNSTLDIRLNTLQINEMNNIETRFKTLINTNIFDHVIMNGKTASLRDMFQSMKIGNTLLFIGVEKESRRNDNMVFLLIIPGLRSEAQKQIAINLEKNVVIVHIQYYIYETLVVIRDPVANPYYDSMN